MCSTKLIIMISLFVVMIAAMVGSMMMGNNINGEESHAAVSDGSGGSGGSMLSFVRWPSLDDFMFLGGNGEDATSGAVEGSAMEKKDKKEKKEKKENNVKQENNKEKKKITKKGKKERRKRKVQEEKEETQ